jgi:hypothetical protein
MGETKFNLDFFGGRKKRLEETRRDLDLFGGEVRLDYFQSFWFFWDFELGFLLIDWISFWIRFSFFGL